MDEPVGSEEQHAEMVVRSERGLRARGGSVTFSLLFEGGTFAQSKPDPQRRDKTGM